MAGRPRCCLQPDCSPGTRSSVAPEVTSVLSAGAVSREGFPRGLIVGVMQSLQLRSAETFRHRDFSGIFALWTEQHLFWAVRSPGELPEPFRIAANGWEMRSWLVHHSGLVLSAGGSVSSNSHLWPFPRRAVPGRWVTVGDSLDRSGGGFTPWSLPRWILFIVDGLSPQPASPVLSSRRRQGRVWLWASSRGPLWPSVRGGVKALSRRTGLCEGSRAIAGRFERATFEVFVCKPPLSRTPAVVLLRKMPLFVLSERKRFPLCVWSWSAPSLPGRCSSPRLASGARIPSFSRCIFSGSDRWTSSS